MSRACAPPRAAVIASLATGLVLAAGSPVQAQHPPPTIAGPAAPSAAPAAAAPSALPAAAPTDAPPTPTAEPAATAAEPAAPAPAAPGPDAPPAAAPITPERIAAAPPPEKAAGIVVARQEPGARTAATIALTPPRVALMIALSPVRLALWAEDRYHVTAVAQDLFWNDARTIGLYPVATWDGGSGFTAGGQLQLTDLAGATFSARATGGNREREFYTATLGSGRLLGPVTLEIGGRYRVVMRTSFYGFGDSDDASDEAYEGDDPPPPIDPRDGERGIDAQFGFDEWMARTGLRWNLPAGISLSAGGSMRWVDFGLASDGGEPQLPTVYQVEHVAGFTQGVKGLRGELALQVDRRRIRYPYLSTGVPSSGWAAQVFGGYQLGLDDDPTRYPYVGGDVVGHVDLYRGDRVLALKLSVDSVLADLEDVPFIDTPQLGGRTLLRGYSWGRFRDRIAYVASAEYSYPIARTLGGFLFVDAGKVGRDLDEVADGTPRIGYGAGLQLLDPHSLIARAFLASTSDGGLSAVLTFEAPFAPRRREGIR
jgi:hypothetical protein